MYTLVEAQGRMDSYPRLDLVNPNLITDMGQTFGPQTDIRRRRTRQASDTLDIAAPVRSQDQVTSQVR